MQSSEICLVKLVQFLVCTACFGNTMELQSETMISAVQVGCEHQKQQASDSTLADAATPVL